MVEKIGAVQKQFQIRTHMDLYFRVPDPIVKGGDQGRLIVIGALIEGGVVVHILGIEVPIDPRRQLGFEPGRDL